MKGIKTLILILCINWVTYAQMYNNYYHGDMSYLSISTFTSIQLKHESVGIQLKGDFETWYAAFNFERLKHYGDILYQTGFSVGKLWDRSQRRYYLGVRANTINIEGENKPSFGLETEVNQHITYDLFVGLGATADAYWNSPDIQTPTQKEMIRGFIKIGYKF